MLPLPILVAFDFGFSVEEGLRENERTGAGVSESEREGREGDQARKLTLTLRRSERRRTTHQTRHRQL